MVSFRGRPGIGEVSMAYSAAVIGAGFASGQEIGQFFVRYGEWGYWGLALATVILSAVGAMIVAVTNATGAKTYREVYLAIFGPLLGSILEVAMGVALATGLVVMLSGLRALLMESLPLLQWELLLLSAALAAVAALGQGRSLVRLNYLLVPFMLVVMAVVGTLSLLDIEHLPGEPGATQFLSRTGQGTLPGLQWWWWSAILYASFNLLAGVAVLVGLGGQNPGAGWRGAVLGGVLVGSLGLLLALGLDLSGAAAAGHQLPMVQVAGRLHPVLRSLYAAVLWAAMTTTAAANVYGLSTRLFPPAQLGQPKWWLPFVLVAGALPLSQFQFSGLVLTIYPLLGYLGLFLLAGVIGTMIKGLSRHLRP